MEGLFLIAGLILYFSHRENCDRKRFIVVYLITIRIVVSCAILGMDVLPTNSINGSIDAVVQLH